MDINIITQEWLINTKDLEFIENITSNMNVEIFKAYWRKHQVVCVKKLKVTIENQCLIEREIDILSKCVHPKVCQYFGSGMCDGHVYMVFEYMENGNLEQYIRNKELTDEEKDNIMKSILMGMNYLSSRTPQKILHRDFKPSNILVGKHGEIKICDFGVSKELYNETNTMSKPGSSYNLMVLHCSPETYPHSDEFGTSHTGIGTLRWAAPEIILENSVYDERCDIYSFGLLAFFIVTNGEIPYYEEYKTNLAQIAYAKSVSNRPFLKHAELIKRSDMLELVTACTEKDPEARPKDANHIIDKWF